MKRHPWFLFLALFAVLLQAVCASPIDINTLDTESTLSEDWEAASLEKRIAIGGKTITAKNFRPVPKPLGRKGDAGSVFIGLFATHSADSDAYHWSVIAQHSGGSPQATLYHARNPKADDNVMDDVTRWVYETKQWSLDRRPENLVAYLEIGKVGNLQRLSSVLAGVHVPQGQCQPGTFTCKTLPVDGR